MKKSNFLIGFAILFTFFAPFIFTLNGPEFLDFTEKGEIGDTIAGTTAPIIGLVNAILLYFTLREQIRAMAEVPLAFEPGERWLYGFASELAAGLLEVL